MNYALRAWWGLPQVALTWLVAGALLLATPGLRISIDGLLRPQHPTGSFETALPEDAPPPAPAFVLQASNAKEREQAVTCLAQAVYFEAGDQPVEGQRAIAQVVLNRVRDPNFPSSICGVVYERHGRARRCQFSFVCDGSLRRRPPTEGEMREARGIADAAVNGYVVQEVGTATHYHATYVDPWWKHSLVQITQIGDHIFYRWPGKAGLPGALHAPYGGGELKFASLASLGKRS